jgi:hypothetical protein
MGGLHEHLFFSRLRVAAILHSQDPKQSLSGHIV